MSHPSSLELTDGLAEVTILLDEPLQILFIFDVFEAALFRLMAD